MKYLLTILKLLPLLAFTGQAQEQKIRPQRTIENGGSGGESFDDSHFIEPWGRIRQISVRHGLDIDGIGISWENGYHQYHGGTGGTLATITLEPDEWITSVSGKSMWFVNQLVFKSNTGRRFGPYGSGGGVSFQHTFNKANLTHGLLYVFGRAAGKLDSIAFGFGRMPASLPFAVVRSQARGGLGGRPFDDLLDSGGTLGKVQRIRVRHAARIDSIEVKYAGNDSCYHGGNGGKQSEFVLRDDEYIVEVRGAADWELSRIQFFLNSGRVSPQYGGSGGKAFSMKFDGYVVKSFFGRSGGRVDQIGIAFMKSPPIRYEIMEMTYQKSKANVTELNPITVDTLLLENPTIHPQNVDKTITITLSDSHTTSIAETHGFSVSVGFSGSFTVVVAASISAVTVGYNHQHSETTGRTISAIRSETFTVSPTVQANDSLLLTCKLRRQQFQIPWTAKAKVTYADRPQAVLEDIHGLLTGVSSTQIDVKYEKPELT